MMRCLLTLLILVLLLPLTGYSTTVSLVPGQNSYALGLATDILEDEDGHLTISQVASPDLADRWRASTQTVPHFVYSSSTYWLRLRFESHFSELTSWWLVLGFPLHDYVDYFVLDQGELIAQVSTGDRLPFATRPVGHELFLFELTAPAHGAREVYLRFATEDGLHEPIPLTLWDKDAFALANGINNLWLGIYFGVMAVMAFYNLFIYLSVRDKAYLYYVSYILTFSLWLFSYNGFAFRYFWPDEPDRFNQSLIVLTCLWSMCIVQFVRFFLDTRTQVPWFEIVAKAYLTVMVATLVYSFFGPYAHGILLVIMFGLLACIAGIAAGITSLRNGYRPARYYLLAWTALLVSIAIFCLKVAGVIPTSWLIERGVQIGSLIEVVLLSLGLADRINILKKEKMMAQEAALQAYESSIKVKNDFLATISHELRTPMNAIMGGVEILQQQTPSPETRPTLDIIAGGATHMMGLVNKILIQAEIQSGQARVHSSPIEVRKVMTRLISPYRDACIEKGLQFESTFDDELPQWIALDNEKTSIIVTNLLSNAVEFTAQGKVSVSFRQVQGHSELQIEVSDTGPGIDLEHQHRIFETFTQKDSSFLRKHGGLGIGLSICKHLSTVLQGALNLVTGPDRGSLFTLQVPYQHASPPTTNTGSLVDTSLPILIVEDNRVNQQISAKMLEKLGFSWLVAQHGLDALDVIAQHKVCLVLMDLQMPEMDGFACTRAIRNLNTWAANLPIIAVTANLMDIDKQHCIDAGMNDFLQKPLSLPQLRDCLHRYVMPGYTA